MNNQKKLLNLIVFAFSTSTGKWRHSVSWVSQSVSANYNEKPCLKKCWEIIQGRHPALNSVLYTHVCASCVPTDTHHICISPPPQYVLEFRSKRLWLSLLPSVWFSLDSELHFPRGNQKGKVFLSHKVPDGYFVINSLSSPRANSYAF